VNAQYVCTVADIQTQIQCCTNIKEFYGICQKGVPLLCIKKGGNFFHNNFLSLKVYFLQFCGIVVGRYINMTNASEDYKMAFLYQKQKNH